MKKLFMITFFVAYIISCKKSAPEVIVPPPPPSQTYTITASSSTHGTVTPASIVVKSGDSARFTFTADNGYRVSTLNIDGISVGDSMVYSYTFPNVKKNSTISATFTDSLLQSQLDSINQLQIGRWHNVKIEYKPTGSVFTEWYNYPIAPCSIDDYNVYKVDFNYESHQNGTFCSNSTEITDAGEWSFSPNGKWSYLSRPNGTKDSVSVVKLTADSSITIFSSPAHIDYKYYAVHL